MPNPMLKSLASKAGISEDKIELYWDRAKKEAKSLGQEDNYKYIVGILKSLLKIDEHIPLNKDKYLVNSFIESNYLDFNKYIEEIVSTQFAPSERPEHLSGVVQIEPTQDDYVDAVKKVFDSEDVVKDEEDLLK